jgi:hypothetical protein
MNATTDIRTDDEITYRGRIAREIYESIHDEATRISASKEEAESLTFQTLRDFLGHYRAGKGRRALVAYPL